MAQMSVSVKTAALSRSIIIPAETAAVPCVRQFRRKNGWMPAGKMSLMLPISIWFFTVPELLNPIIYSNQKLLYDALYHAASATIRELTEDPRHLGAKVGYIFILPHMGI